MEKKSRAVPFFIRLEISKKEGKIKYSTESIIFRESFLKLDVYSRKCQNSFSNEFRSIGD